MTTWAYQTALDTATLESVTDIEEMKIFFFGAADRCLAREGLTRIGEWRFSSLPFWYYPDQDDPENLKLDLMAAMHDDPPDGELWRFKCKAEEVLTLP